MKFKVAVSKMKSHAALWWENLQNAKRRQVKEKIKMWTKMLRHLKANLCPKINNKYFLRSFTI